MTNNHLRVDLLHALAALLPEAEATLIRSMPLWDPMTHVEAYTAARRADVTLPGPAHATFVAAMLEALDDDLRYDTAQDRRPVA